jgi:hypothetical protein
LDVKGPAPVTDIVVVAEQRWRDLGHRLVLLTESLNSTTTYILLRPQVLRLPRRFSAR